MALYTTHKGDLESADGHTYTVKLLEERDTAPSEVEDLVIRSVELKAGGRGRLDRPALLDGELSIEIVTGDVSSLSALSAAPEGEALATLERDSAKIWRGFLLSDFWDRPLGQEAFPLSLSAKSGLGRLENIPFDPIEDGWASGVWEKMTLAEGLGYILSRLHPSYDLWLASDLHAEAADGTSTSEASDPLDQIDFWVKRFYDDSNPPDEVPEDWLGDPVSCRDALRALCGSTGGDRARRRVWMEEGTWHATDYELLEESSYDRERYSVDDAAGTVTSAASETFTPTTVTGDSEGDENGIWIARPSERYVNPVSKATIDYDHGEVPSLVGNGSFEEWTSGGALVGFEPLSGASGQRATKGEEVALRMGRHLHTGIVLNFEDDLSTVGRYRQKGGRRQTVETDTHLALTTKHYVEDSTEESIVGGFAWIDVYLVGTSGTTYRCEHGWSYAGSEHFDSISELRWLEWRDVSSGDRMRPVQMPVEVNELVEHTVRLPAAPEAGEVYVEIYQLVTFDSPPPAEQIYWHEVRLDLVDEEGAGLEGESLTVSQGTEDPSLDDTTTALADGPTLNTPGALSYGDQLTEKWYRSGETGGVSLLRYHAEELVLERAARRLLLEGTIAAAEAGLEPVFLLTALERDGKRCAPSGLTWRVKEAETTGTWVERKAGTGSLSEERRRREAAGRLSGTGTYAGQVYGIRERERSRAGEDRVAVTSDKIDADTQVTSLPVEALDGDEVRDGDRLMIIDVATLEDQYATVDGDISEGDTSIPVEAVTFDQEIAEGSFILPTRLAVQKALIQAEEEITLRVKKGEVLTEINIELGGITFDADKLQSDNFDGTFSEDANGDTIIDDPGTVGWAITEAGEAAFEGVYARDFIESADLSSYLTESDADSLYAGSFGTDGDELLLNARSGSELDRVTVPFATNAAQLGGYPASDYPRKNEAATISQPWTFQQDVTVGGDIHAQDDIFLTDDFEIGGDAESDNFAAKRTGWQGTRAGEFDVRRIYADEMVVKTFTSDVTQALAGSDYLVKSVSTLASSFTVPSQGNTATLHVNDLPGHKGSQVFSSGDWIRLGIFDNSGGGLVVLDAWGTVSSYSDQGDGTQQWTFTREDSDTAADGHTIGKDAPALDYGQSGQGLIRRTVEGSNAPYSVIETWTSDPSDTSNYTSHVWLGNLSGAPNLSDGTSPSGYGMALYGSNGGIYMEGHIVVTGGSGLGQFSDALTSELTDDANLGDTAIWNSITGSGKPEDDATKGADLSTNVTNATADNIAETAARKWAGEAGADVTANNAQAVSWLTDAGAFATEDIIDVNNNTTLIDSGAIVTGLIAADAVVANKIASGAVVTEKLAADAVTADKASFDDLEAVAASIGNWEIQSDVLYHEKTDSGGGTAKIDLGARRAASVHYGLNVESSSGTLVRVMWHDGAEVAFLGYWEDVDNHAHLGEDPQGVMNGPGIRIRNGGNDVFQADADGTKIGNLDISDGLEVSGNGKITNASSDWWIDNSGFSLETDPTFASERSYKIYNAGTLVGALWGDDNVSRLKLETRTGSWGITLDTRSGTGGDIDLWADGSVTVHTDFDVVDGTKNFLIDHPTKEGWLLRHSTLEGPEAGVYHRGRLQGSGIIELPGYWHGLVREGSVTVDLTPNKSWQRLYVAKITPYEIYVGIENGSAEDIDCFFVARGERKDVDPLVVEEPKPSS